MRTPGKIARYICCMCLLATAVSVSAAETVTITPVDTGEALLNPRMGWTMHFYSNAGVQLSYWWCYQSDRPMDQEYPQRFDLTRERNPKLMERIVKANKRLQAKYGIPARVQPAQQSGDSKPQ